MFVGGYVPSYRNPAAVDYSKLSHVFYAFASTNNDGDLLVENETSTFITFKTASAGKQRFLSLAGGGGHAAFSSMTTSVSAIQTFAENCVAFCKTNDFQGIDMDWEGITTSADSTKFGSLLRALATELHENNLTLVVTLGYGSYGGDFYNVGALKKADWIQLMVYDQTGTWAASPFGNHSTQQHVTDAINYWKGRGYTSESKIVIGLPFYGYQFNSTAGGLASGVLYSEIVSAHPNLSCDQDQTGLTVFNGPETIRQKVIYAKTNGLKGVMIWELGQDLASSESKSLLRAVSLAACDQPASCENVVLGLTEKSPAIQLVKNPVDEVLQVSLEGLSRNLFSIELMDVTGKTFFTKQNSFSDNESIRVDKPAGVYFLRFTFHDRHTKVMRFIKQ